MKNKHIDLQPKRADITKIGSFAKFSAMGEQPTQLRVEDYTVGVVCALPVELAAVLLMLDEEHRGLPANGNETNLYTLGRIAMHNVAIVCLPVSQTGTSSAAVVAAQMKSRFTSIRFGLMVGVGGGAPGENLDIRLGDVAIGLPQKNNGGVIQYDLGKTEAGGKFTQVGCLDKPPTVLLNAISKLQAHHYYGEGSLSRHMTTSQAQRKFHPPDRISDVLFEPQYHHVEGSTCAKCDIMRSIKRIPRENQQPIIHYGTIASGNQVMKDGIARDQLSAKFGGVVCFEMEAAGLINNFPCLVIRGICDYADSHKHKDWQPYAAATAAACAKEVLSLIPQAEVAEAAAIERRDTDRTNFIRASIDERDVPMKIVPAEIQHQAMTCTTRSCFNVPFDRNPFFVGRTPQISELENHLCAKDQPRHVAIVGLGGVGKTQIVLELAYRTKDEHPDCSVFWVPATNMANVQQAYVSIAHQLCVPGLEGQEDVKKLVQRYLSNDSAGRWLIIFDNADDVNMWVGKGDGESGLDRLIDYLPRSSQGSIVFTTRNRKGAVKLVQNNFIELYKMEEDVALRMLQNCLHDKTLMQNQDDGMKLLDQLTYLPLAIAQAAAYINENDVTLSEYSALLSDREESAIEVLSEDFEDQGRYHSPHTRNPVATTWLISLEHIRRQDCLAVEYLSFMACIDPRDIPLSLLPGATLKKKLDAIGTLNAYSFITKRTSAQSRDIHPLVHLVTRNWLRNEGSLLKWRAKVIARLNEVFPTASPKNRTLWRAYLPHVRYILDAETMTGDAETEAALLDKFGLCLIEDGLFNEAKKPLMRSLEMRKRILGAGHPATLSSMASLAAATFSEGRYKDAEDLDKQLVEKSERVLGPKDSATLARMAHLALTYRKQGLWKKSEELELVILKIRKELLGQEHPDTLDAMVNLGATLEFQERHEEAEELLRRVMEQRIEALGLENPDTLYCMFELAWTLYMQGLLEQAERLELQVIETRNRILEPEHPATLESKVDLGQIYLAQRRYEEAEHLLSHVNDANTRSRGEEHPETLISRHYLAAAWAACGRRPEAIESIQKTIILRKRVIGVDHHSTQRSIRLLSALQREDWEISLSEICGWKQAGMPYYG